MGSMDPLAAVAQEVAAASTAEARLLRLADLRQAVDAAFVSALAEAEEAPGMVHLGGAVDAGLWLAARSELHPAEARGLAALADAVPTMPSTAQRWSRAG